MLYGILSSVALRSPAAMARRASPRDSESACRGMAVPPSAQLSQVIPEPILDVTRFVEPALEQHLEISLRRRTSDRFDAGIPTFGNFDIARQAGIHESLGIGNRPLVEGRDTTGERVDESIELGIRQRTVHVAVGLRELAANVIRS